MPRNKKPWPTKDAMVQIYENNLWGGEESDFYSGSGSHDLRYVTPYIEKVASFLADFEPKLRLCDLGCGDFNVGNQLIEYCSTYVGIDIVPELINRNQKLYKSEKLEFKCMDIVKDPIPDADGILLRNVLQHLSNKEIVSVVEKLYAFKYVILTEHVPSESFEANIDIISGQGIRLKKSSGVDIKKPPFNFKPVFEEEWLSIPYDDGKGVIKTTLYKL